MSSLQIALFKTYTHLRFASMSSLHIALFKTPTLTHKGFASMSSLHRAVFESVYVSVLYVCANKFLLPFSVAC